MKRILHLSLVCLFLALLNCGRTEEPNLISETTPVITSKGKITGKILAANGTTPIGGALVFTFDNSGKLYSTLSLASGDFVLDAPSGIRTIHMQTGDGANFRSETVVDVKQNESIALPNSITKLTQIAKMAYVKGSYDEIEAIVQSLGYNITQITYNNLKDMSVVDDYDIIFLNCGSRNSINSGTSTPNQDTVIYNNLSTFVSNGGSLYASDWDVAYLIGGESNSSACGTPGGFIPDNLLCATTTGTSGILSNCLVSDPNLAAALGFNTLNIQYDLGSWEKIINYSNTFWDVMVKHNSEALMLKTNKYHDTNAPSVTVGNTSNNGYITICHNPSGNNPITLTIPLAAWPAHQGHGDSMGPCTGNANSGNIFYTTFHNHASGNIGNTGPILQYVILNL